MSSTSTGHTTPSGHELSSSDLEKQAARKQAKLLKKSLKKAQNVENVEPEKERPRILRRDWYTLGEERERGLRVMTWNMLAQTLVREYRLLYSRFQLILCG